MIIDSFSTKFQETKKYAPWNRTMWEMCTMVLSYISCIGMKYLILVGKVKYHHFLGERKYGKDKFWKKAWRYKCGKHRILDFENLSQTLQVYR